MANTSRRSRDARSLGLFATLAVAPSALSVAAPCATQSPVTTAELFLGEPSGWTELALPAGGIGAVRSLGTLVTFQTSSAVHLWSAITRQWSVVPVGPGAQVTQFNAFAIIEDGSAVHAYATRTGAVQSLQLSGAPTLHFGPQTSSWLAVATLGNEAWGFGSFHGQWVHQALASATPTVTVAQTAAILEDGATLYGLSAYEGGFVATGAPLGKTVDASGDVGIAWTPSEVAAFSAHFATWSHHALSGGALVTLKRGYALFRDGADLTSYSASTGTFATAAGASAYALSSGHYVAALTDNNEVIAYSSGQNRFVPRLFQSPPLVFIDEEVVVVQDSAGIVGFSVVAGDYSAVVPIQPVVLLGDAVAWAEDGAAGYAYSPVANAWTAAPTYGPNALVSVLRNIVVLSDPNGYSAFSGRTAVWSDLSSVATTFHSAGPASGDMFVAFDGTDSHVFDPTLSRWARLRAPSAMQSFDIWRQTFVGSDGVRAQGFGLMNNTWSTVAFEGNFQQLDANSSCGYLLTDTHLYTYSAHGTLSTLSRFPEFSRLQPVGAKLRLIQAAPTGSQVTAIFGLAATYMPGQAFGTLFIDPASIIRRLPLGQVPGSGVLDYALDLSHAPALRGTSLHIQNMITPAGGHPWLTNLIAPIIL